MSEEQSAHHTKNEIIIVKRRLGEGHDDHHGGVWKIAYADFMTAMMAFFLVMWLVNAANDKTKAAVASYFNPIKLVDQTPVSRGIHSSGSADGGGEADEARARQTGDKPGTGAGGDTGHDKKATSGEKTKYSDADYFDKPFAVLAEIAQQSGEKANVSSAGEGGAQRSGPATGASGGKAYRDPFDPDFWVQQVQAVDGPPASERDIAAPVANAGAARTQRTATLEKNPSGIAVAAATRAGPAVIAATAAKAAPTPRDSAEDKPAAKAGGEVTAKKTADAASKEASTAAEATALQHEIRAATKGTSGTLAEGIRVKAVEGGVLVSVTDRVDDGMFNVGSAVPRRDMVIAMQKIGRILAGRKGRVVIRGYTDARPFKGNGYDNWRLSTARAQSAYYMLVNGGLDKQRVGQIAGFADRDPIDPQNPYAAANRRIEILLRTDGSDG
ncbi:MAG: MotB family protein [Pararhizobium sp.]